MGSKYNAVICNKCNNELEIQEHEFGNTDVLYITPCKHCIQDKMIKETYSGELEDLRQQDSILINFFQSIDMCVLSIKDLEDDFKKIKDRLNILDTVEPIIDRIIPEYQDVPLEYKVLLLKERTANQFITTPHFGFNEDQIDQLVEALTIDKIQLIKKLRELTGPNGLGLKEAKDYIESKISSFDIKISFPEARKIILENF
jgi:ribosomal protein L7/L12